MECTGIILAGGQNKRMKRQKAFLEFNDKFLIEILINLFQNFFNKIIIVTDNKSSFNNITGAEIIEDAIPHRGPLSGIYYGLIASRTKFNFVSACDSPFIQKNLIQHLLNTAYSGNERYDITIPYIYNRYEPLLAIYSSECTKKIKKALDNNIFKISDIFSDLKIKEIEEKDLLIYDPELKSFTNLNTPEEYRLALAR
ncbi:molybdenum cofactor guanylyltransferase [Candidatus Poribacteria bacterium]|nr:molybdenum cofactor guanylyltransferase [Candidatus Poribacteria bacterium]